MIPARTNFLFVAVLLIGQLGLNACQSETEAVIPAQASTSPQKATASDWIEIDASDWAVTSRGSQMNVAGFVDNSVTNSVVEKGLVVAFYRTADTGDVYPLPVTIGDHLITFTYYAMNDKGIVSFQQEATHPIDGAYRWIVVPKEAASGVDWTDYNAVKLALGLKE